ncbi:MAG: amidohydrolase 3, partial [Planctomycetaceae bacterium]|nr:amidohydrolase 3 [Planctomycetaceae bacterium]
MNNIELIIHNGKITTLDPRKPEASAIAISGGRFVAVGDEAEVLKLRSPSSQVINLGGRRLIPGLNDS